MISIARMSIAAVLCAAPIFGLDAEWQSLIDMARAAPAEFAADALIRIAASDRITAPLKRELLEEAFRRGPAAQQQYRRRAITPRHGAPSGFLDRAFRQQMDACSLQCRAVRGLLPLDRALARRLFAEIPPPHLERLACEDALVYDLSLFYETLGEVLNTTFTAQEIDRDVPFQFAARYSILESPVQIAPMARLLTGIRLKSSHFAALTATFATGLGDLSGDDRSFSAAIQHNAAGKAIAALVAAAARQDAATQPLIAAYRTFLVRHLSAARCADAAGAAPAANAAFGHKPDASAGDSDPVAFFNASLRIEGVPPIGESEAKPAKLEGEARAPGPCGGPDCDALGRQYTALLFGPSGLPYTEEQKAASEWQAGLIAFLGTLADWKETSSANAAELFEYKATIYSDLLNVTPNGTPRERVLRAMLAFLRQNAFQRESRIEWFLPVNSVIGRVYLDPLGLARAMDDLARSEDAVIALYANLERLVPRRPDQTLSLF